MAKFVLSAGEVQHQKNKHWKMLEEMKLPKNDEDLEQLLRKLGRNTQQIEAIRDFGKLSKALDDEDLLDDLRKKYKIK